MLLRESYETRLHLCPTNSKCLIVLIRKQHKNSICYYYEILKSRTDRLLGKIL
jgi:hypothetical protein